MSIDFRCDVAVVGAGPVGLATASAIKLLTHKEVCVFDKRNEATRRHPLRIQADSIDFLVQTIEKSAPSNRQRAPLLALLKGWKNKAIPTEEIQESLTKIANDLGIRVLKGKEFTFNKTNFAQFCDKTKAKIIIGADGSKSQVREAIGSKLSEEFTLSYLLDLKYRAKTAPRKFLDKSIQNTIAEGFDFETIGRKKDNEGKISISLQKFIDEKTYLALKTKSKGSSENPWNMKEIEILSRQNQAAKKTFDDLSRYLKDHRLENQEIGEKIAAFPIKIYRSECVAKTIEKSTVLLVGDASSGLVLERGVNKGFIESALCAKAVFEFFKKEKHFSSNSLSPEFQTYERDTQALFLKESRLARFKMYTLKAIEAVFVVLTRPLFWALSLGNFLIDLLRAIFKEESKEPAVTLGLK